jgi:hypothetical protein
MAKTSTPVPAPQPPALPPAPAAEAPEEQVTERPVTRKELEEAVALGVQRAQQSARDRTQRIETEVKALTDRLEQLDVPVTPEITAKLRTQVATEMETQEQPETQTDEQPTGNPVYDWTMELYKTEGIEIKPTDPEWKEVKAALDDPNGSMIKYQKVMLRAIDSKRERTATESQTADARTLGTGQTSGQAPAAKSARDLWKRVEYK